MPSSQKPTSRSRQAPVPITFDEVLPADNFLVANCLPYADMARIPARYQAYARWHHRITGSARWQDACPAYALAYLTFSAYGPRLQESFEWEVELQWEELCGESGLDWPAARVLIVDAWRFLGADTARDSPPDHK